MSLFQNALDVILNNYADVIEGGSAYRGSGTSWKGLPGYGSNDPGLRLATDTPLTAITGTTGTTTVEIHNTNYSWETERWVKVYTPGFFLLCTSATNSANVGAARRITGWDNTEHQFTTDAFPATLTSGDVFSVMQGFKRIQNNIDIMNPDLEINGGYDRCFHFSAGAGEDQQWYGSGVMTLKTTLDLQVRFLKYSRAHDVVASAMTNMAILRAGLCRGEHRDGTYTRALLPTDNHAEVLLDDPTKIVISDKYDLLYRINTEFL